MSQNLSPNLPTTPSSILSGKGAVSPTKRQRPPRPKITISIPPHQNAGHVQSPFIYPTTANVPQTALSGGTNMSGAYPQQQNYGEFMFKQFEGFKDFTKVGLGHGEKVALWIYGKFSTWSKKWFTHIFLVLVVILFSLAGAGIFIAVEGPHEKKTYEDVRAKTRDVAKAIRLLNNDPRLYRDIDQWEGAVIEQLESYREVLLRYYNNGYRNTKGDVWTFWNAVFYCGTIYTTIGYGHIAPVTTTGRTVAILYSVIGIPIFLILLADFGKLFTRGIKFLWAYVRGLYYTGSCRRVRKTVPMQDMMRGMNIAYDFVRRPSQFLANADNPDVEEGSEDGEEDNNKLSASQTLEIPNQGSTPQTPMPSEIEIDDEFNLPISLALFILISYILLGAAMYSTWETWTFFESFYFVFISMSTIGFGDYVPNHPMFMMASIVYLVFGLSLTSMCINVVQLKLSDSFRQASSKIRETIGLAEAANSQTASPDLTSVHSQANDAEKKSPID